MRKKIGIVLFILIMFVTISNVVYADGYQTSSFFDGKETSTGQAPLDNVVSHSTGTIMTVARIAAITVAVIMLLVCGMKYMISAPGDRADLKKHMIPYLVGAVIIFSVTGIISMITSFVDTAFPV